MIVLTLYVVAEEVEFGGVLGEPSELDVLTRGGEQSSEVLVEEAGGDRRPVASKAGRRLYAGVHGGECMLVVRTLRGCGLVVLVAYVEMGCCECFVRKTMRLL